MFYLTRLAVELLSPLNVVLVMLITGLLLCLLHKRRLGFWLISAGVALCLLCGYAPGAAFYIEKQEQLFPALQEGDVNTRFASTRYIVVLGSGHVSDSRLPYTSRIGGTSLYRLVEGIRLHRLIPGSTMIITGGIGFDPVPNARVVSTVASQLGVGPEDMLVLDTPEDTLQEAEVVAPVVDSHPFFLVTSALHMPRAMAIFRARGLNPIAAPTDFIIKNHLRKPAASWLPRTANFDLCKRIFYEKAGAIWSRIKAQ